MKIRSGFITNSSSTIYIVENKTDVTKTMWDLLQEAAEGGWELVSWPHYSDAEFDGETPRPLPKNPQLLQKFREAVARTATFPPHRQVEVWLAWGDGEPIFCPLGLKSYARSFKIICPPQ